MATSIFLYINSLFLGMIQQMTTPRCILVKHKEPKSHLIRTQEEINFRVLVTDDDLPTD